MPDTLRGWTKQTQIDGGLRKYTGSYTDATTGLIHDGARYYDTNQGRFTQQAPAGQGPNLYAYSADDPVNLMDPAGRSFLNISIDLCVGLCVSLGVDLSSGSLTPTLGVGAGPSLGIDASATANAGVPESGASVGVSCTAGGAVGSLDTNGKPREPALASQRQPRVAARAKPTTPSRSESGRAHDRRGWFEWANVKPNNHHWDRRPGRDRGGTRSMASSSLKGGNVCPFLHSSQRSSL